MTGLQGTCGGRGGKSLTSCSTVRAKGLAEITALIRRDLDLRCGRYFRHSIDC